jgi:Fe-S-cluster containining protein
VQQLLSVRRFQCLFCRECCYFEKEYEMPTVFPWEKRMLEELAEKMEVTLSFKPIMVFRDEAGRCIVALYRWIIHGYCPFLDRSSARCRIHSVKPLSCRMYPLVLEIPTGKLMVSFKCKWVAEQGRQLAERLASSPELIAQVFPSEFNAAVEAYTEIMSILEYVKSKGLKEVKPEDLEECGELYDIDEYIARFG